MVLAGGVGEPVEAVLGDLVEVGAHGEELAVASGLAGKVEGDHAGDGAGADGVFGQSGAEADGGEQVGGGEGDGGVCGVEDGSGLGAATGGGCWAR